MRIYRAAEWMSSPPIVIATTTTLAAARHLMEQRQVFAHRPARVVHAGHDQPAQI